MSRATILGLLVFLGILCVGRAERSPPLANREAPSLALTRLPPVVTSWYREDGLPQNAISAVTQTRDGYLWISTYNGLARFDGVSFKIFDQQHFPVFTGNRITALHEDRQGRLWVGEETGNVVIIRDAGRTAEIVPSCWPRETIMAIRETPSGEILLLLGHGELVRASDGRTWRFQQEDTSDPRVLKCSVDSEGGVWLQDGKDRLVYRDGDQLKDWTMPDGEALTQLAFAETSRQGGLWIIANRRIRRWLAGRWVEDRGESPYPTQYISVFHELADGTLVMGALDVGLVLMAPGSPARVVDASEGLASDWVTSVTSDREGNVWAGTAGGLTALRPRRIEMVRTPDDWNHKGVLSIHRGADGALWVGTEGAGLYRLKDDIVRRFGEAEGLTKPYVWTVQTGADGTLWVGTWGQGLFVGRDDHFSVAPGWDPAAVAVTALHFAKNGDLLAGTNRGLARLHDGDWTWWREADGQPLGHIRTVAEDSAGRVWFGTSGRGLGCLDQGGIRRFDTSNGLPSLYVWALLPRGDDLWIGTSGGGLARHRDGRFDVLSTREGLPSDTICSILTDDRADRLWFTSFSGVFSLAGRDLDACMTLRRTLAPPFFLDRSDGLATIECAGGMQQPSLYEPDGSLWVASSKGLARLATFDLKRQTLSPPVFIQAGLIDDEPVSGEWDTTLSVAPGRHRIEIKLAALNFSAPEKVRLRYRLEGLEDDWVDIGHQRSIHFSYLPPGRYRLHVAASNRDGYWNELGDRLDIVARPHFWQSWPVQLFAVAAGAGLVAFLVRARVLRRTRLRMADLERRHAVERERTRIAQDLHDDLGVSLTRLHLLSQTAQAGLADPVATRGHLAGIRAATVEITRAMDEIVWAANPRHDTFESLVAYLARFTQETLSSAGLRCRLDLPLDIPDLPLTAEFRHNLFLACKESLHNALRHALATEVLLSLRCDTPAGMLLVTITDNGRGFTPPTGDDGPVRPGESRGNGLRNLRQRLLALGGRVVWDSAPGKGASVRLEVPLPRFPTS